MKAREYDILTRAIEEGVIRGWRRAHKHTNEPDEQTIRDHMMENVLESITEVFDFEFPPDTEADLRGPVGGNE